MNTTKKKHTHRRMEQTGGYQLGEERGVGQAGEGAVRYTLLCIK